MLMPKRVKRRRVFRGRMKGKATRGNKIAYGQYGLIALEPAWITSNQIEAARIAMTRQMRRGGKVWINIFPHKPVTEKPAETRMGSGKGSPEYWVAVVKPGTVMFEVAGVPEEVGRVALERAAHKLPIKTKFEVSEFADDFVMRGRTITTEDLEALDDLTPPTEVAADVPEIGEEEDEEALDGEDVAEDGADEEEAEAGGEQDEN